MTNKPRSLHGSQPETLHFRRVMAVGGLAGLLVLAAHWAFSGSHSTRESLWMVAMMVAPLGVAGLLASRFEVLQRQAQPDRSCATEHPGTAAVNSLMAVMRGDAGAAEEPAARQPGAQHTQALTGPELPGLWSASAGPWPIDVMSGLDMHCGSGSADHNRRARDLHDGVSQTLFASNLLVGALAQAPQTDESVRSQAGLLQRLNRSALAELRMMLYELKPETLNGVRMPELLSQAVEALAGRGGIDVSSDIHDTISLPKSQRLAIYRIAQAALSNIGRHSGATRAHLRWQARPDGAAVLQITDNGCGFDVAGEGAERQGVQHIRDCAQALGAALNIQSSVGQGTDITLTLETKEVYA